MYSASIFVGGDGHKIPGSNTSSADFKTRATNCFLLTVTIVCVCILVACGVMVVREYALGKDYHPTTCDVVNVTYDKYDIHCVFCATSGKDKASKEKRQPCVPSSFPCAHIWVRYVIEDGRTIEGLLHPDSLQAAGAYAQCSYTVCLKSKADNQKAVESYANGWMTKKESFQCFYNTLDTDNVIVIKMHDKYDVIHSMLWPSIAICICGVIFLRLEVARRGGVAFCNITPPDALPTNKSASSSYQTTSAGHHSGGRDAYMMQIKQNASEINGQGKVHCKIVPKSGEDCRDNEYLLTQDKHHSNSVNSIDSLKDTEQRTGGKGCGSGRKGKAIDKSAAANVKNSRSAEALKFNHITQEDGLPSFTVRQYDSNCSSPGSGRGQETPV